jgi:hypothetical protein
VGILKLNPIELINVLSVLGLLTVLLRKLDAVTLRLVLFVCGTFHFSFAVIALATNDAGYLLMGLHSESGGMLTDFVMRLQIFPDWLFIGLVFIICLMYWRQPVLAPNKAGL